jgi:hypothetical protein
MESMAFQTVKNGLGNYVKLENWENLRQEGAQRLSSVKPWTDFFDQSRFSKPKSFQEFSERLKFNMGYFQNNYLLVGLICIAYFLVTNLWLLFSSIVLIGGFKAISALPANQAISIAGSSVTQAQLWTVYSVFAFFLLMFTGFTGTVLYILGTCFGILCLHAGFIEKPVLSEFDEQV